MVSFTALCALFYHLSATLASPRNSIPRSSGLDGNRVLYFMDSNPTGSYIISVRISAEDGTLSSTTRTSTGGNGLAGLLAVSQDSIVVSGQYLFSVNPGSDTLSMFRIDPETPMQPVLIGEPVPTMGHTPISVAYSKPLNTACVLNAGNVAGVTCYSVDPVKGLSVLGPTRFIPQTENSDPTMPPAGPLILGMDITFNPSSTALFVTIRSNGGQPGLIYAWAVARGQVGLEPVVSSLPGIVFPFSLNFLSSDSRLLITNPHFNSQGAAILDISPSLEASEAKNITVPGQIASCWVAYAPVFGSAFLIDAARNIITTLNLKTDNATQQFEFPTPVGGAFDTKVDRNWLYTLTDPFSISTGSLTASPQIVVFNISPITFGGIPQQVQSFDIFNAIGTIPDLMGLALYPSTNE